MPLYSTAEITPNCNIGHPMSIPNSNSLCTSQLWATRRSGSLLYWPQPSFTVGVYRRTARVKNLQSRSKSTVSGHHKSHAFWVLQAEACHSVPSSIQVQLEFPSVQTEFGAAVPNLFLIVVEGESHELRSDKKSPLATALAIGAKNDQTCIGLDPSYCFNFTGSNLQYVHDISWHVIIYYYILSICKSVNDIFNIYIYISYIYISVILGHGVNPRASNCKAWEPLAHHRTPLLPCHSWRREPAKVGNRRDSGTVHIAPKRRFLAGSTWSYFKIFQPHVH